MTRRASPAACPCTGERCFNVLHLPAHLDHRSSAQISRSSPGCISCHVTPHLLRPTCYSTRPPEEPDWPAGGRHPAAKEHPASAEVPLQQDFIRSIQPHFDSQPSGCPFWAPGRFLNGPQISELFLRATRGRHCIIELGSQLGANEGEQVPTNFAWNLRLATKTEASGEILCQTPCTG